VRFLFMGQQEDPEFDTIEARGNVRIYDGTDAATECRPDCEQEGGCSRCTCQTPALGADCRCRNCAGADR